MQDGRKRTIHRLKEERDGEMWRKVNGYVITAVIRIVTGLCIETDWNVKGGMTYGRSECSWIFLKW